MFVSDTVIGRWCQTDVAGNRSEKEWYQRLAEGACLGWRACRRFCRRWRFAGRGGEGVSRWLDERPLSFSPVERSTKTGPGEWRQFGRI